MENAFSVKILYVTMVLIMDLTFIQDCVYIAQNLNAAMAPNIYLLMVSVSFVETHNVHMVFFICLIMDTANIVGKNAEVS